MLVATNNSGVHQQTPTTRLEQTFQETVRVDHLLGAWNRRARFVWFTNTDEFKEKLTRKPKWEIFPDYTMPISESESKEINKSWEEDRLAQRFIFDKLIFAHRVNFAGRHEELHFVFYSPSRSFSELFNEITDKIIRTVCLMLYGL